MLCPCFWCFLLFSKCFYLTKPICNAGKTKQFHLKEELKENRENPIAERGRFYVNEADKSTGKDRSTRRRNAKRDESANEEKNTKEIKHDKEENTEQKRKSSKGEVNYLKNVILDVEKLMKMSKNKIKLNEKNEDESRKSKKEDEKIESRNENVKSVNKKYESLNKNDENQNEDEEGQKIKDDTQSKQEDIRMSKDKSPDKQDISQKTVKRKVERTISNSFTKSVPSVVKNSNSLDKKGLSMVHCKSLEILNDLYASINLEKPQEELTEIEKGIIRLKDASKFKKSAERPVALKPKSELAISKPLMNSVLDNPKLKEYVENDKAISVESIDVIILESEESSSEEKEKKSEIIEEFEIKDRYKDISRLKIKRNVSKKERKSIRDRGLKIKSKSVDDLREMQYLNETQPLIKFEFFSDLNKNFCKEESSWECSKYVNKLSSDYRGDISSEWYKGDISPDSVSYVSIRSNVSEKDSNIKNESFGKLINDENNKNFHGKVEKSVMLLENSNTKVVRVCFIFI